MLLRILLSVANAVTKISSRTLAPFFIYCSSYRSRCYPCPCPLGKENHVDRPGDLAMAGAAAGRPRGQDSSQISPGGREVGAPGGEVGQENERHKNTLSKCSTSFVL